MGKALFGRRRFPIVLDPRAFARRRAFLQAWIRVGLPLSLGGASEMIDPFSASQLAPTRAGQAVQVGL
jgi:hypothetical protein